MVNGPQRKKICFGQCEQQRHRPACAFAQSGRLLESFISKLATSVSFFVVSVADQTGLGMPRSHTLEKILKVLRESK